MKVKLSKSSSDKLSTVNPKLQKVILKAFENMPFDVTILEGIRSKERQAELFAKGASKTMNSKHLTGNAIDIAPYPVNWNDKEGFVIMAECILLTAMDMGIKVRWGGDWNMNGQWKDESFYDGPHFELI